MPRLSPHGSLRPGSPASHAAQLGAVAVALGMSLGVPGTLAVAAADTGAADASAAAEQARPDSRPSGSAPRSAAKSPRLPGPAASRTHRATAAPTAAAAGKARNRPGPADRALRPAPAAVAARLGAIAAPMSPTPSQAAVPATTPDPQRSAVAGPTAAVPAAAPVTESVAAAPSSMATARVPAGPTSSALGLGGFFAKFRALFDGGGLLLRRSLFNKPPTVNPVQLTGQSSGPITGTIGAVDPDGDAIVYKVTGNPSYGSVTVGQDGSYTYTPGTAFAGSDTFVVTATDSGFHINLLSSRGSSGTPATVSVRQGQSSSAPALRFQFNYGSGAQFWSTEARSALELAAARLASYFVVSSPVTITYDVTGQFSPLSPTLASAGSDFANPQAAGFLQTVVQNKIQTGVDANGSAADGTITWNFGPSWAFGNTATGAQYDFQSTAMHELLHTFGFLSNVAQPGANIGQTWTVFDSFMVDSVGNRPISSDYNWIKSYNQNLTGGNGGLYFNGPNAVAANRGLVSLYTPSPWESGSSVSHLNDGVFTGAKDAMMTSSSNMGLGIRTLSAVELGVLKDLGFRVTDPSPALMFLGLVFLRRTRRAD